MSLKEKLIEDCKNLIILNKYLLNLIEKELRFRPDVADAFIEFSRISDREMAKHELHSFWKERITKQKV
jgi:hypothetical protein